VKQSFATSVGRVEVLVDEQTRIVSAYRFDPEGRPVAAALESLDYSDLADVLARQAGVPPLEANDIASVVTEAWNELVEEPLNDSAEERRSTMGWNWAWGLAAVGALLPLAVVIWATLHVIP
jgi:hypothetical protein